MAEKVAAAPAAEKVPAPAPAKVAKPKKPARPRASAVTAKAEARLVSFSVSAVIPTQQYGNIQPRIEVTAPTIEEARALAMPHIDELYRAYAEMPLSGRAPRFYGKVTEEVKVVAPEAEAHPLNPTTPTGPEQTKPGAAHPLNPTGPTGPTPASAKPESVLKAEMAIQVAQTLEGIVRIGQQIERSVKIPPELKGALAVLVAEKRKALGDTGAVAAN